MFIVLSAVAIEPAEASLYSTARKLQIPESLIPITGSTGLVQVQLNGNEVKPGDTVPAKSFRQLEFNKITWTVYSSDARYTLMLIDLDRKSIYPQGQMNLTHFNIYNQYTNINIPGNLINVGQTITAFDAPSVPCSPGVKHRLALLVFHQDEVIDMPELIHISASTGYSKRRENIQLQDIMTKAHLTLHAANIFQAVGESGGVCSGAASAIMLTTTTTTTTALLSTTSFILTLMVSLVLNSQKFSSV